MTTLYNTTLHVQDDDVMAAMAADGFQLTDTEAHGVQFPVSATWDDLVSAAKKLVKEAKQVNADGVLIGGMSGMSVALYLVGTANGLRVYEVATERLRVDGMFKFEYRGMRELTSADIDLSI